MQALRRVAALASRPATIRSALPFALMLGGWVAADLNPDVASEPPSGFALFFRVSTWACVALCVLGSCAGLSRVGSLPALPAGARFVFFEPATSSASYRADARPRPAWLAGSVVSRETAIQQARASVARRDAFALLLVALLATPAVVAAARGLTVSVGLFP